MKTTHTMTWMAGAVALLAPQLGQADWNGFIDASDQLQTDTYAFFGTHPDQVNSNENYYDGDFADFDGDGLTDRALGARYGLLMNTGGGWMTPYAGLTGFLLRGMPGATGWGEDGFQWVDVDGDGDYDNLSGGNGEPLTLQINRGGRFSTSWQKSASALNIVNTDIEGDGDVDLVVAHSFCANSSCGGPVSFQLLVNTGDGTMNNEAGARGLMYTNTDYIVGVVSGDLDGDGDYDLAIQHGAAGVVEVAVNDGSGNYTLQATPIPTTCSGFGQAMNLGDIDDDGDLDLVIGRCPEQTTGSGHPDVAHTIGINDGSGSFTNESADRWDSAGSPDFLSGGNSALMDVDYDGDLDYVALRTDNMQLNTGVHQLQIFFNDGAGYFTFSAEESFDLSANGSALGADTDITDLDGDGSYDIWVGIGGDRVRILLNSFVAADGLPADVPRDVQVESAEQGGVTISWQAPPFASMARYYEVYRATSPSLFGRDRRLVKVVGERFQDEAFVAPITRHTTTADLGDPDVELDGANDRIRFTDTGVQPGVTYQYAVVHVGAENTRSAASSEVFAQVPEAGGADADPPVIDIVAPTDEDWWSYPRVVAHFADGGSGVDPATVSITFDAALGDPNNGGRAAGEDVSDLAYRLDAGVALVALQPPLTLPDATLVTMTVTARDLDGNEGSAQRQFFVTPVAAQLPTADFTASALSGEAPFVVDFDASASDDADGKLLRWEWYFGDGTTAIGRTVSHTFAAGGSYPVTLLVRDNEGGVDVTTQQVDVEGEPPPCQVGEVQACYTAAAGTEDVGLCHGGQQQCLPGMWGECSGEVVPTTEVCDDGEDNDCDGDVDDTDTDCGGPGGAQTGGVDTATGGADGTGGADTSGGDDTGAAGEGGCGCRSTPHRAAWPMSLLVLAVVRRRPRRVTA